MSLRGHLAGVHYIQDLLYVIHCRFDVLPMYHKIEGVWHVPFQQAASTLVSMCRQHRDGCVFGLVNTVEFYIWPMNRWSVDVNFVYWCLLSKWANYMLDEATIWPTYNAFGPSAFIPSLPRHLAMLKYGSSAAIKKKICASIHYIRARYNENWL